VAETATEAPAAGAKKPAAPTRPGWRESVESLLITIILALFATCFVVQAFKIPSESMEPTLLVGDHLLVNKFIFESSGAWYDRFLPYRAIRRGDVVVFKFPYQDHPFYVKRVIGLPGDHIKIVNSVVYVNGQRMNEPYVEHDPAAYDPFAENFPPASVDYFDAAVLPQWAVELPKYVQDGQLVVPPGRYFVMGDNRDHSWDSRYWGFVPKDAVMGRPFVIYWSLKEPEQSDLDVSTSSRKGILGMLDSLMRLPFDTRWHRMFKGVH